jgi:hypothetical protein
MGSLVIFKYGDKGLNDHGWGCVYRNIQTAVHYYSGRVVDMDYMLTWFQTKDKYGRGRWLEPVDACKFIDLACNIQTRHLFFERENVSAFTRTDFSKVEVSKDLVYVRRMVENHLDDSKSCKSVIIDNGTFSYILFASPVGLLRGDPHCASENLRVMSFEEVFGKSCSWSLCFVG